MGVGSEIKQFLDENNISQTTLSIETKIPLPKLNLMLNEKRRIQISELEVICWALNVKPDKFVKPRAPGKVV